jgi:GNAT superfamily N-acetyltransferase
MHNSEAITQPSRQPESFTPVCISVENKEGVPVGKAELYHIDDPFPCIYVKSLAIEYGFEGNGYGSQLIEKVKEYIRAKKMIGVLLNGTIAYSAVYDIHTREPLPITEFYEHHGWSPIWQGNTDTLYFNNVLHLGPAQIDAALQKSIDLFGIN